MCDLDTRYFHFYLTLIILRFTLPTELHHSPANLFFVYTRFRALWLSLVPSCVSVTVLTAAE
jgi:hypothetical protein